MAVARNIASALRDLPGDERGDEGVSKMLILLLVTVPIILVLVLFGGKIVDEFQVGMCNLGVIDPPLWQMVKKGYAYPGADGLYPSENADEAEWSSMDCAKWRLELGEGDRPPDDFMGQE